MTRGLEYGEQGCTQGEWSDFYTGKQLFSFFLSSLGGFHPNKVYSDTSKNVSKV